MDFKALSKPAIKAGLIMAAVFVVIGLLGIIPFVGCVTGIVGCILAFVPGILACYFSEQQGKVPSVGEGAILGAIAGPIVALSYIITVPVGVLLGGASQAAMMQAMGQDGAASVASGGIMAIVIGIPVSLVVGGLILAAINAGTGAIYAAIKNR